MSDHNIDAVISWVDGNDPQYQKKLAEFCFANNILRDCAIAPTRYQQIGEIEHCVLSLLRFAPWLRTIYLITDHQVPARWAIWQKQYGEQRLQIITQDSLFYGQEQHLPVFNSLSIEWVLYRIPGLSPQFIYLNDDFFFTRAVLPEDFFRDEKPVLQGNWKTFTEKKWRNLHNPSRALAKLAAREPHRHWYEQSARHAGFNKKFYMLKHTPYPLLKSTYTDFIATHPDIFAANVRYPFRDSKQIAPVPLMAHLDIQAGRAHVKSNKNTHIYIHASHHSPTTIDHRLQQVKTNQNIKFLCIQSMDQTTVDRQKYLLSWLDNIYLL